ncbi:MAG: hypothetical protein U0136_12960 [Bdellovibrionota bacterium]
MVKKQVYVVVTVRARSGSRIHQALDDREARNALHASILAAVVEALSKRVRARIALGLIKRFPSANLSSFTVKETHAWRRAKKMIELQIIAQVAPTFSKWFCQTLTKQLLASAVDTRVDVVIQATFTLDCIPLFVQFSAFGRMFRWRGPLRSPKKEAVLTLQ